MDLKTTIIYFKINYIPEDTFCLKQFSTMQFFNTPASKNKHLA